MERYKAVLIAIGTVAGVAALIVFGLADLVHVKSGLPLREQQLVGYQHQETALNERKAAVFDGLKGR